jgi:H+-translocating NAD(P) transhydrogenase
MEVLSAAASASWVPRSTVSVGVLKEAEGDNRVVITPENVAQLIGAKGGFGSVVVESGAGARAGFMDQDYIKAGATIGDARKAGIVLSIAAADLSKLPKGAVAISLIRPGSNPELVDKARSAGVTTLALDCIPRISRAQVFDVLSSQANIAGYRSVIEAAEHLPRLFGGQVTAAGRVQPAKVLVIGGGVAGLAAVVTAKNLGAIVRCFDTRPEVREQVVSVGGEFLELPAEVMKEAGGGGGGYAKEMSKAFLDAEMALFAAQAKEVDVIITTALIPGRPAPRLILEEHVKAMRHGSVTVDLAAETGGNVATTKPGTKHVTPNGVTCIGYTDLPSRMAPQASTLFGNNVTKFLLSLTPPKEHAPKDKGLFFGINLDDEVTRGALITMERELTWPAPPPPSMQKIDSAASKSTDKKAAIPTLSPEEAQLKETRRRAMMLAGAGTGLIALGMGGADAGFQSNVAVLALSVGLGVWAVRNVAHSLHTPLISATNALSGFTALGGLHLLASDGSLIPSTAAQWLGAISVAVSTTNIVGGSMVTQRMLNMFRRPTDPPEHNHLYGIPAAATLGAWGLASAAGFGGVTGTLGLAASLSSIGAIAGLSSQSTARMGNALAVVGLGTGTVAAIASLPIAGSVGALTQVAGLMGAGGSVGAVLAKSISPMELPQSVAAMHALVGVAAAATSVGAFLAAGDAISAATATDALAQGAAAVNDAVAHHGALNTVEKVSIFLGAWIGAITATGSVAAFAKLQGLVSSASKSLPARDLVNGSAALLSVAALGAFASGDVSTGTGLAMLSLGAGAAGFLGGHLGMGVGGADAPVLLTVLNSYSGWALCAEGFALHNPLLLTVGALIGSSGAFLSLHMCEAMNRSLPSVILGGWGTAQTSSVAADDVEREHVEISVPETAQLLKDARRIAIVPGYGMAVAQAQHAMAQIHKTLRGMGKRVDFVIHPVAGRMPGQLNVLLAEAGVPYDDVLEMEDLDEEDWAEVDVAIVMGANDTVNPAAEEDPNSPIAGMPVIPVWKASRAIVVKRSMGQGYSAVDNPLFYRPEVCSMLLGDANKVATEILSSIQERA